MGRRTALGVLACALLLTGCAEKREASTTLPPASAAASSSSEAALPAVGPADFPVPMEARQHTPAGVQAFTRYYIDLMTRQLGALDPEPFLNLSRSCETCNEFAQGIQHVKEAGHHFRGGAITVSGMGSAGVANDEGDTSFVLDETPTAVLDGTGSIVEVRSTKQTRYTGGVIVKWDTARSTWLMAQLDADPL